MTNKFKVLMHKGGIGKNSTGAELTLQDTSAVPTLQPFSIYVFDEIKEKARIGMELTDLIGKEINVNIVEMVPAQRGAGLQITGDFNLAGPNNKKAAS